MLQFNQMTSLANRSVIALASLALLAACQPGSGKPSETEAVTAEGPVYVLTAQGLAVGDASKPMTEGLKPVLTPQTPFTSEAIGQAAEALSLTSTKMVDTVEGQEVVEYYLDFGDMRVARLLEGTIPGKLGAIHVEAGITGGPRGILSGAPRSALPADDASIKCEPLVDDNGEVCSVDGVDLHFLSNPDKPADATRASELTLQRLVLVLP